MRRWIVAGAIAAAGALPAHAGLFDDEEARRRIDLLRKELMQQGLDNEARIARLEESIRNIGVIELVRQLEQINAEMARLRGQLEVLGNENQQMQKRQRDFYLDLDSRLKRLEGGTAAGSAAAPVDVGVGTATGANAAPPRTPTKEDQAREIKAYDAASNLFRRNDFPSAVDAFRAFVKDFPSSPAIAAIQAEQGDSGSARNTLEDIIARFPASEAAGKARTRLTAQRR